MNGVRPVKWVGMPWHGLAVNGTLTTTIDGNKTISGGNGPGYPGEGACVLVRHPSAPGAGSRTAAQLAEDAAHGYEWRDYALLCGPDRHVNGGPALGANAWIYIDPAGTPWRMTVESSAAGASVNVTIWRRALFGRFGRAYTITDEQVGSFVWTPQMPSWYTGGVTATMIAADAVFDDVVAMVPNADGSNLLINVYAGSTDAVAVFPETEFTGRVLLGILDVTVSGTGDLQNTGIGIAAAIVEDARFEDDLVTLRTSIIDLDGSNDPSPLWEVICTAPTYPPSEPTPAQADANDTTELEHSTSYGGLIQGGLTDYTRRIESASSAIVYRTHRGDVTRYRNSVSYSRFIFTDPSGSRSSNATWEAYWDNPPGQGPTPRWRFLSCSPVTGQITQDVRFEEYDELTITYNALGISESVAFIKDDKHDTITNYLNGCWTTCIGSDGTPSVNNGDASLVFTCNGETYPGTFGNLDLEAGMTWRAPNLFALWSDFTLPDNATRRFTQRWIGDGESSASQVWLDVSTWTTVEYYSQALSPLHRRSSFQPVTVDFSHGVESGDKYQYC